MRSGARVHEDGIRLEEGAGPVVGEDPHAQEKGAGRRDHGERGELRALSAPWERRAELLPGRVRGGEVHLPPALHRSRAEALLDPDQESLAGVDRATVARLDHAEPGVAEWRGRGRRREGRLRLRAGDQAEGGERRRHPSGHGAGSSQDRCRAVGRGEASGTAFPGPCRRAATIARTGVDGGERRRRVPRRRGPAASQVVIGLISTSCKKVRVPSFFRVDIQTGV